MQALVPEALQVGRKIARPAARDEQVAPELEVERVEPRILLSSLDAREPFVGGRRCVCVRRGPSFSATRLKSR